LITVLVYCFPTFKFPNAYINLYLPLSPSDLVVTVVACFSSFCAHRSCTIPFHFHAESEECAY